MWKVTTHTLLSLLVDKASVKHTVSKLSVLKMEVVCLSETVLSTYKTTWRYYTEKTSIS
jgi:hypothetical protein